VITRFRTLFNRLLSNAWGSLHYEDAWACGFTDDGDIALDAASCIGHPLEYYLIDIYQECCACDVDKPIVSRDAMRTAVAETVGVDPASSFSAMATRKG